MPSVHSSQAVEWSTWLSSIPAPGKESRAEGVAVGRRLPKEREEEPGLRVAQRREAAMGAVLMCGKFDSKLALAFSKSCVIQGKIIMQPSR